MGNGEMRTSGDQAVTRKRSIVYRGRWVGDVKVVAMLGVLFATSIQLPTAVCATAKNYPVRGEDRGVEGPVFEELWRLNDEDDVLIGLPIGVLIGDAGSIYILDGKLMDVKVFNTSGEFLRSLGREGDGPGEFRNASEMTFLPDGTIGVAQSYPAKIISLKLDGTAGKQIRPVGASGDEKGAVVLTKIMCGGRNLVLGGMDVSFDQANMTMRRRCFVSQYDMTGNLGREYYSRLVSVTGEPGAKFRETDFDFVWDRMVVGPDGRVFIAPDREEYRIDVYSPDGNRERVIRREYESWPRNGMAKAVGRNVIAPQLRMFQSASMAQIEVADLEPDIEELWCAEDGALWVMTSRAMWDRPDGVYASWDVFGLDGVFQKQVQIRVPGNPVLDWMVLTDHGYVLKITNFLDRALVASGLRGVVNVGRDGEELEVICYRMK